MSPLSRWLNWTPGQAGIIRNSAEKEPSKPTKPSFDGFDGPVSGESEIIQRPHQTPTASAHGAPQAPAPTPVAQVTECPYLLPEGVKLVRFTRKNPPVAVTVCSVVTDIPKFIQHALDELDARLNQPIQIRAGDSVFELVSKLADCGLEVRIEWPADGQAIEGHAEMESSKPLNPPETPKLDAQIGDITDLDALEDLPL